MVMPTTALTHRQRATSARYAYEILAKPVVETDLNRAANRFGVFKVGQPHPQPVTFGAGGKLKID